MSDRKRANLLKGFVVALLAAVPLAIPQATTASFEASVVRTLATASEQFGGCMVRLDRSPREEGLDCPEDPWVTFSCSGTHASSKAAAMRMLDSAQLAFVTGRKVRVWVDDARTHNGFCFVSRIDVLPAVQPE